MCKALGLETNFVKVKKEQRVHSIAEVKLDDGWYIFDVSTAYSVPVKGVITQDATFQGWKLWKKGRDAWDFGLTEFESITKIA